ALPRRRARALQGTRFTSGPRTRQDAGEANRRAPLPALGVRRVRSPGRCSRTPADDLDDALVGQTDRAERAAVHGAGVDADAERLVPADGEVAARRVAVDD